MAPGPASPLSARAVTAGGLEFGILEAGSGPLALCLHGYPDTAHTWRHLLPALADAGFHAVAPFTRGYAPTAIPPDGCYHLGALAADAIALHEALGGDERAVVVGHDWGAAAAYGAAAFAPDRWRRLVTLAVPPLSMAVSLFSDYEQLQRFFYFFFFKTPLAEAVVGAEEMAFIDRQWEDWSPGYDAGEDLRHLKQSLRDPANLSAAISYYRGDGPPPERYAAEEAAVAGMCPQPTLYLHGDADGCIALSCVEDVEQHLSPGSRLQVVHGTGHFLHLEKPAEVNEHILGWLTA